MILNAEQDHDISFDLVLGQNLNWMEESQAVGTTAYQ